MVDPRFWPLDRDDLEKSIIHGCQRFRSDNYRSRFRLVWLWAVFRFWWDLKRALPNRSLFLVFAFENQFYRYFDLIWITSGGEQPVYRISNMFTSFIWLLWSLSIASCLKHLNKHHHTYPFPRFRYHVRWWIVVLTSFNVASCHAIWNQLDYLTWFRSAINSFGEWIEHRQSMMITDQSIDIESGLWSNNELNSTWLKNLLEAKNVRLENINVLFAFRIMRKV